MAVRRTVMIACVSFETAMVVDPAVSYNVDEIHLFHYVRDDGAKVYRDFYDEVVRQLAKRVPRAVVVEHAGEPVYKFQPMLRDILAAISGILEGTPDADIAINASSGTSEFSAAAVIASLMNRNVSAFTVGTREFTVGPDDVRKLYYVDGRPVGLTAATHPPRQIPAFEVEMPEENLVRCLRLYARLRDSKAPVTAVAVIKEMKARSLWEYVPNAKDRKTDPKQKEVMFYQRHYVKAWQDRGWIEKASKRSKYDLTVDGRNVIETFYVNREGRERSPRTSARISGEAAAARSARR